MHKFVLLLPFLLCLAAPADAGDNVGGASATGLGEFTGVWAHSEADCKSHLSGELDELGNSALKPLQLIGICAGGFDLLAQPINCSTTAIEKRGNVVEFDASCRVKDYPREPSRNRIELGSPATFKFDGENWSVSGPYVRCSQTYSCAILDAPAEQEPGSSDDGN